MKKLLIIDKHHFGSLTDIHKWCEYLRNDYNITMLCFDTGREKMPMNGIKFKYVNYSGNFAIRGMRFLLTALWHALFFNGKIIVVYFENCHWLKRLLPFKKMIVDIRTLSVTTNAEQREKYDTQLRNACRHFDMITAISEGVKQKINLPNKRIKILPLGSDVISEKPKDFSTIKLLYVGTFADRDLHKTIEGLALFIKNNPDIPIEYDIIGDGFNNELQEYKALIYSLNIADKVTLHGQLPYNQLKPFFEKCNIGVSFVPITEYFDHQPPTKTFEYILSGLYTIATATYSNKELITAENGILIHDSATDFANAISIIWKTHTKFDEQQIRKSLEKYSWKNIVNGILKPILIQL